MAPPRTAVVILGDTVDRHRPGITVLDAEKWGPGEQPWEEEMLASMIVMLAKQAPANGGRVIRLVGNHEMWNTINMDAGVKEFVERYASPVALSLQGGAKGRNASFQRGDMHGLLGVSTCASPDLCELPKAAVQIGGWAFVHGGLAPEHIEMTPASMNVFRYANLLLENMWREAERGKLDRDDPRYELLFRAEGTGQEGWSGMLWDRKLGFGPKEGERALSHEEWCPAYTSRLLHDFSKHNAKWGLPALEHVVVSHCVQERGAYMHSTAEYGLEMPMVKVEDPEPVSDWERGLDHHRRRRVIYCGELSRPAAPSMPEDKRRYRPRIQGVNAECDGAVWRLDVGMSRAMHRAEIAWANYATSHGLDPANYVDAIRRAGRPVVLRIDTSGETDVVSVISAKQPLSSKEILP